jgi:hypothetical protein
MGFSSLENFFKLSSNILDVETPLKVIQVNVKGEAEWITSVFQKEHNLCMITRIIHPVTLTFDKRNKTNSVSQTILFNIFILIALLTFRKESGWYYLSRIFFSYYMQRNVQFGLQSL